MFSESVKLRVTGETSTLCNTTNQTLGILININLKINGLKPRITRKSAIIRI